MFYIIGLGLGDAKDITLKGLEVVNKAERVYLEAYTSVLSVGKDALEQFYGRNLIIADRDLIEQGANEIMKDADSIDVALLVVGDPFGATTHTDLVLRAKEMGIKCKIIHNASIMNAIGCCGLQLYNFGETVSIPYWTNTWKPDSFYDKICENRKRGLHTLCLLDIRVKEPTVESIMKKKIEYEPPRFMSVSEATGQLLEIILNKDVADSGILAYTQKTLCVGVARVGSNSQQILACTLEEMKNMDLGPPLHSLVIPGRLHPLELQYLEQFSHNKEKLYEIADIA